MLFGKKETQDPRTRLLKDIALFGDLSRRQLRIISALMHERTYVAGEIVFDEGEQGQALYIVISGRVAAQRRDADGPGVEFGPGTFFGELALLEDAPRSSSIRALEDTTLVALFRTDFLALLETHSRIASRVSLALARDLAGKLRRFIATNQPMAGKP